MYHHEHASATSTDKDPQSIGKFSLPLLVGFSLLLIYKQLLELSQLLTHPSTAAAAATANNAHQTDSSERHIHIGRRRRLTLGHPTTVESTRRGLPQLDSCAKQLVAADRSFRADPPCVRREFILFKKVWGTIVFYKSPIPVSDK